VAARLTVPAAIESTRPRGAAPLFLELLPEDDYALLDSGAGAKLEQYGAYRIVRPEAQAVWQRTLGAADWANVDAVFTGDTDEEGMGRWHFPLGPIGETW